MTPQTNYKDYNQHNSNIYKLYNELNVFLLLYVGKAP